MASNRNLRTTLTGWLTASALSTVYGLLIIASALGKRRVSRGNWTPQRVLVVTGTFYNSNWLLSHASPLVLSDYGKVIFVTDTKVADVPGVDFVVPPRWMVRLLGRNIPKLLCLIHTGYKHNADMYMGYHVFPGAAMALILGKLFGRPAIYQMAGGPPELEGGGYQCENPLLRRLFWHHATVERLANKMTDGFERVIVRGGQASNYLQRVGIDEHKIRIIPGSIDLDRFDHASDKTWDIIFVGRLSEIKQPHEVVEVAAELVRLHPDLRVAMVGDGPLLDSLQSQALDAGLSGNVTFLGRREDVELLLSQARIFILTSRSEGLSIALAEAMAAGCVPVVADVGELSDLVDDGTNGYLIEPDNIKSYASRIGHLLDNPEEYRQFSQRARQKAADYNSRERVSQLWSQCFDETLSEYSANRH